ncbi:hypothetical protein PG988_007399 [Apiospora saccharicola]
MIEGANCYCAICGGPLIDMDRRPAVMVVPEAGPGWTGRVHVIGWRGLRDVPRQAHVSAPGRYQGNNRWYGRLFDGAINPGGYRRTRYPATYSLYRDLTFWKPAFPFHGPCYYILERTIVGRDGQVTQDFLKSLYATMENMTAYSAAHLAVDYGFVGEDPRQSYWTYRRSQSWLLLDSSTNEAAQSHLRKVLFSATFSQHIQSPSLDLGPKVRSDLFIKIPLEIIHMIVTSAGMDVADILNLSNAS